MTRNAERRIRRARELSSAWPFAREILSFYEAVAAFQDTAAETVEMAWDAPLDPAPLAARFAAFLGVVRRSAPETLARTAAGRPAAILSEFWAGRELGLEDRFLALAFLQPHAEQLAARFPRSTSSGRLCPVCGRRPVAAILRERDYGAARSLLCSFCSTEWGFERLCCPRCGEQRPDELEVYGAAQMEHVRVDACRSCQTYIKTVDLTKNGLAEPLVDELAAVPLDLWAGEQGYRKLELNMVGL